MKRNACILMAAALLTACATTTGPAPEQDVAGASTVRVLRQGDIWTADYALDRDAPAWLFTDSALARADNQPWRPRAFTVLTPGVRVERRGWHDVLVSEDGGPVPRNVRIRFEPFSGDLLAAYDPALKFTDGSVALYTDQFDMRPLADAAAAAAAADDLPMDLNGVELEGDTVRALFRDRAGSVLMNGERRAEAERPEAPTYVLFGDVAVDETEHLAAVFDPELPDWIETELSAFTPQVMSYYADRLGAGQSARPTLMVSWAGPTPSLLSMGGSVLPGLIIMTFEGVGALEPTPEVRSGARWFIAHEGAHFWLGQVVSYERVRDMWITEGGADILAARAMAEVDPAYDALPALQTAVDECSDFAARPIHTAAERSEHQAYYACGAVFHMLAEAGAARTGGDVFTVVRGLIDASREDEILSADEWLAELTRLTGDASLAGDIRRLLTDGAADPTAEIASLFQRAGVAHEVRDGRVVLL
jgi:hypothetical protein